MKSDEYEAFLGNLLDPVDKNDDDTEDDADYLLSVELEENDEENPVDYDTGDEVLTDLETSKKELWIPSISDRFAYVSDLQFVYKPVPSPVTTILKPNSKKETPVEAFLSEIKKYNEKIELELGEEVTYRGFSKSSYDAAPKLFRIGMETKAEKDYYQNAIRLSPQEFSNMSAFDVLCKMQHYGTPTRLLDLTSNPLVALWFACNGSKEENNENGKVTIIPGKFYPSDIHEVQIICLAGDFLSRYYVGTGKLPTIEIFRDYLLKKNIWCGGEEYKEYLHAILSLKHVGIKPAYSNQRIKAQQGLFMLFGISDDSMLDDTGYYFPEERKGLRSISNDDMYTISIPKRQKRRIREQLTLLGFDKSRIFPELEHASEYVDDLVSALSIV